MYFYDTGLACHLLGMDNEQQVETHYLKGALYENMVIAEILKGRLNKAKTPNLYFWRDLTGHEVDLIGEWGGKIKAIEIKSGTTFQPEFIKNVRYFYDLSQKNTAEAVPVQFYLIYGGDYSGELMQTRLLPFTQMDTVLSD
jgi:predicted AAA+ superfamily ATPase